MTSRSTPDLSCTSPHGSDARDQYSKTTLLCLDFDLTLTQTHLFQYTASMIREGFDREEAILRAIRLMEHQGPRGGEELWSVLAMWLNHGHTLAVTSFTAFPELPIALLAKGVSKVRSQGVSKERIPGSVDRLSFMETPRRSLTLPAHYLTLSSSPPILNSVYIHRVKLNTSRRLCDSLEREE